MKTLIINAEFQKQLERYKKYTKFYPNTKVTLSDKITKLKFSLSLTVNITVKIVKKNDRITILYCMNDIEDIGRLTMFLSEDGYFIEREVVVFQQVKDKIQDSSLITYFELSLFYIDLYNRICELSSDQAATDYFVFDISKHLIYIQDMFFDSNSNDFEIFSSTSVENLKKKNYVLQLSDKTSIDLYNLYLANIENVNYESYGIITKSGIVEYLLSNSKIYVGFSFDNTFAHFRMLYHVDNTTIVVAHARINLHTKVVQTYVPVNSSKQLDKEYLRMLEKNFMETFSLLYLLPVLDTTNKVKKYFKGEVDTSRSVMTFDLTGIFLNTDCKVELSNKEVFCFLNRLSTCYEIKHIVNDSIPLIYPVSY